MIKKEDEEEAVENQDLNPRVQQLSLLDVIQVQLPFERHLNFGQVILRVTPARFPFLFIHLQC